MPGGNEKVETVHAIQPCLAISRVLFLPRPSLAVRPTATGERNGCGPAPASCRRKASDEMDCSVVTVTDSYFGVDHLCCGTESHHIILKRGTLAAIVSRKASNCDTSVDSSFHSASILDTSMTVSSHPSGK